MEIFIKTSNRYVIDINCFLGQNNFIREMQVMNRSVIYVLYN